MARWALKQPHYLRIAEMPDGTKVEWEHKETNRTTGKAHRKMYPVGLLLNPEDPGDCNRDGECVVCHEGKGNPSDYVFEGDPTPDMDPLDEEAEVISESLQEKWRHPIDTLPANGGMNDAESAFMRKMEAAFEKIAGPNTTTVPGKGCR